MIVAVAVFFFFLVWAFSYYYSILPDVVDNFSLAANEVFYKIINNIFVDAYEIPVKFYSENPTNAVLYAKLTYIPNSTMVFSGEQQLSCEIDGNRIYWSADLTNGENYFKIKYVNINTPVNCDSSFSALNKSNANITIPWSAEKTYVFSQQKINEFFNCSSDCDYKYRIFKENLGINEDFNLRILGGINLTFGKKPPANRDVYVFMKEGRLDNWGYINITVSLWK